MISDTFSCGACYGIQSLDLAAETEPFALMRCTITLQTNATEEMCLRLADSIHDSIRNRVRDVFDPARVAEILASVDKTGVSTLTDEQQDRLFGRVRPQAPTQLAISEKLQEENHALPESDA